MRTRAALGIATFLAAFVAIVAEPSPAGTVVVLWFLAVVPGELVLRRVHLTAEGATRWVIVVATSFALDTLFTEAMVYARIWTPVTAVLLLTAMCGAALACEALEERAYAGEPT
jgi:hypothetical protein